MEWTGDDLPESDTNTPADGVPVSSSVMFEESGIQESSVLNFQQTENPMSTCTLQGVQSMNEANDLSRPNSGTFNANEGPAAKRIKVDDTRPGSFSAINKLGSTTSPPSSEPSLKRTPSSAVSIEVSDSSGKLRAVSQPSPASIATHQVTVTSGSEASTSASSLDASRAGSTSQLAKLAPTSESAKAGGSSTNESPKSALHPKTSVPQTAAPPSPPPPLKSTTMLHLHKKYTAELEYMLREFRKLERQLLGAKGNGTGVEENAGSRERREKLHSFILHLEDTLRQIELGCRLEAEGKSTVMVGVTVGETADVPTPSREEVKQNLAHSGALTNLTQEKEEEENVQKLEEHILANLLPVKVRLKKQLAAQQGASRNPVGMPVSRRGMLPSASAEKGTGTFAAAAEQRRKQAEAARDAAESAESKSQFGKPISGGASSLTQKLHGQTLGSSSRKYGHGVGSSEPTASHVAAGQGDTDPSKKRKILYAGMAPGSKQLQSGVTAASGVHKMVIETPGLYKSAKTSKAKKAAKVPEPVVSASIAGTKSAALPQHPRAPGAATARKVAPCHPGQAIAAREAAALKRAAKKSARADEAGLTEEERKKLRRLRRRKKRRKLAKKRERERQYQIIRQQQTVAPKVGAAGKKVGKGAAGKGQGKKKGPRTVEYICALCSETYNSTCDCNPWWALTSHDCPKCRKAQVPRIDITSPANAIEYHPALLAHAEENASGAGGGANTASGPGVMHVNPSHIASATFPVATSIPNSMPKRRFPPVASDSDSGSDLSDLSGGGLSDDSYDSDDSEFENLGVLSPAEKAENEQFGLEYNGPKLTDHDTSRLLVLMAHASTCPGRHKHAKHRDVCNSVKYLMLHVRDCPGTTSTFDICPFPWCRKVKNTMYHLVSCIRQKDCPICSPRDLSPNLAALVGLNNYRRRKQRERRAAAMAAAAAAAKAKKPAASHRAQGLAKSAKGTGRVSAVPPKGASASRKSSYKPPAKSVAGAALAARKGVAPTPAAQRVHPAGKPRTAQVQVPKKPVVSHVTTKSEAARMAYARAKALGHPIPAQYKPVIKAMTASSKKAPKGTAVPPSAASTLGRAASAVPVPAKAKVGSPASLLTGTSSASQTKPSTAASLKAASLTSSAQAKLPAAAAATTNSSAQAKPAAKPVVSDEADSREVAQGGVAANPPETKTESSAVETAAAIACAAGSVESSVNEAAGEIPQPGMLAKGTELLNAYDAKTVLTKTDSMTQLVEACALLEAAEPPAAESDPSSVDATVDSSQEAQTVGSAAVPDSSPAAVEASAQVKSEKDEHMSTCADKCCTESHAPDLADQNIQGNVRGADLGAEQNVREEKTAATPTRSPESSDMASSCSDEVKKNNELVRISSC